MTGSDGSRFHGIQQQVYRSILRSIVELEIPPGKKLTIGRLKTIYGVSSTPVRGALYKLKEDGLLILGPSKSFYVKEISEEEVRKLFYVRIELEKLALRESIDSVDMSVISNLIIRM
ncbi:MAG TPA: GntR family transcriptional regulator, partial [Mesotoga infera]|nr:GntR family transcriptional regulator [Mesotoga infera]